MRGGPFQYTEWHRETGQRLRALREDAGLSMEKVGDALGLCWQMLQRWETATGRLPADSAAELAVFYGVDVGWLLGFNPKPTSNAS